MESSEQTSAYVSPTIYTNTLIFGKGVFSILLFLNMLINPIVSQIQNICDVTLFFSIECIAVRKETLGIKF